MGDLTTADHDNTLAFTEIVRRRRAALSGLMCIWRDMGICPKTTSRKSSALPSIAMKEQLAFSQVPARKILDHPSENTIE